MFCANCGKFNVEGSRFCEGCGSQLYDNQPPVNPRAEEGSIGAFFKKPTVKIFLFMILGMALLLGVNAIVKSINGPKNTVKTYVQAYKSANWGKVYNMLDLPEDAPMLTKDAFIERMTGVKPDIKKFKIEDSAEQVKIPLMVSDPEVFKAMTARSMNYTVSYTTSESTDKDDVRYMTVSVAEKEKKVGKEYKIDASNVVGSLTIQAPMGSVVYVDGMQLTVSYTDGGTDYYDEFYLFRGPHNIRITSNLFETVDEVIDVGYGSYYQPSNLVLSESVQKDLLNLVNSTLNTVWNGAFAGNELSSLDLNMTENARNNINYAYTYLKDWADVTDGYGLKNASFKNLQIDNLSYYMYDGKVTIEAHFALDYTFTEVYTSSSNGESYDYSRSGYVDFQYTNTGWVITYMDSYLLNY